MVVVKVCSLQVARLQEQLEKEKELRAALESGLKANRGPIASSSNISEKVTLYNTFSGIHRFDLILQKMINFWMYNR